MGEAPGKGFEWQKLRDTIAEKESQISVNLENINSLKDELHKSEASVSSTTESTISPKVGSVYRDEGGD